MVEFALLLPLLLTLVFGIIQYGLYFYSSNAGNQAIGDAVRRLSVGDCQDPAQLKSFIFSRLAAGTPLASADGLQFLDGSGAVATGPIYSDASGASEVAPGSVGDSVTLTVRFPAINLDFPFIPMPDGGNVVSRVFARIEDTTASPGGCT